MDVVVELAKQPLFRLLGAIIVLLITDFKPIYGLGAGLLWVLWLYLGQDPSPTHIFRSPL
jgi:hypothetical protein